MRLSSTAFKDGATLPSRFTCDGNGVSPPLEWKDVPDGTQAFALICEDPDAPNGVFTHWVLYNLPRGSRELGEGLPVDEVLSIGGRQATNSFGKVGYGGACPPTGDREHRYVFKLYALDNDIRVPAGVKKQELFDAMRNHVLAEAQLIGKYKR
ncbi:MAG TPA: YbhB/YbcL family Raf kinase inhibitor-like protein [Pyrinomonadaceae bacterium]